MKLLTILSSVCLLASNLAFGQSGTSGRDVTATAAVRLVPPAGLREAVTWTTGATQAQGTVVQVGTRELYMCLEQGGGVSTNTPAVGSLADGYRWVPVRTGARAGLIIENLSDSGVVYLADHAGVSTTNGLRLNAGGAVTFSSPGAPQGSYYVISASGTNRVAYHEW